MKTILKFIIITFAVSTLIVSCSKKPLSLDKETPMKTLLKASDTEIINLVLKEIKEAEVKDYVKVEDIKFEYILRDEKNQAIVIKTKVNNGFDEN